MQTWTFGPGGIYTATWDGVSKVTVTLTAGGQFVASFAAQSLTAAVASPEYQAILSPAPTAASGSGSFNGGPTEAGLGLGLLTFTPGIVATATTLSDGTQLINLCTAPASQQISHLGAWITTAGVTPGAGVNQLALYSEAGVLLASTGSMTTAFQATGWAEGACAPLVLSGGTNYYLSILTSFTGTAPQIAQQGTIGVPALNGHYINLFQSGKTTLPASFTPSGLSASFATVCMYAR